MPSNEFHGNLARLTAEEAIANPKKKHLDDLLTEIFDQIKQQSELGQFHLCIQTHRFLDSETESIAERLMQISYWVKIDKGCIHIFWSK